MRDAIAMNIYASEIAGPEESSDFFRRFIVFKQEHQALREALANVGDELLHSAKMEKKKNKKKSEAGSFTGLQTSEDMSHKCDSRSLKQILESSESDS